MHYWSRLVASLLKQMVYLTAEHNSRVAVHQLAVWVRLGADVSR
jgi:hypothetical protein